MPLSEVTHGVVQADGVSIHYVEAGEGPPVPAAPRLAAAPAVVASGDPGPKHGTPGGRDRPSRFRRLVHP